MKIWIINTLLIFLSYSGFGKKYEPIQLGDKKELIYDFCITPGNTYIYSIDNNHIFKWAIATSSLTDSVTTNKNLRRIAISKDQSFLAIGTKNGDILIQNLKNNSWLPEMSADSEISGISFHPEEKKLAFSCLNGDVGIIDIDKNQITFKINMGYPLYGVGFRKTDNNIIVYGNSGSVIVMSNDGSEIVDEIPTASKYVSQVLCLGEDKFAHCGSKQKHLYISDFKNSNKSRSIPDLPGSAVFIDQHQSSESCFLGGFLNGKIKIVHNFGKQSINLKFPIIKARFLNDGNRLDFVVLTYGKGLMLVRF